MKIKPVLIAVLMLAPTVHADPFMAEIGERCALYRSGIGVIGMDRTELEQDCALYDQWVAEQRNAPKDTRPLPTINEVGQREAVHKLDTSEIVIPDEKKSEPNAVESLINSCFGLSLGE